MGVYVTFKCGGCNVKAEGTARLRVEFRSFSGRSYGFGNPVQVNTVVDITPPGWIAFDPYTYMTYCPTCWAEIEAHDEDEPQPVAVPPD